MNKKSYKKISKKLSKKKKKIEQTFSGSQHFWNLVKNVRSNFISSSTTPNSDQTIIEPLSKANLIASIFSNNSKLIDTGHHIPIIPQIKPQMSKLNFRGPSRFR